MWKTGIPRHSFSKVVRRGTYQPISGAVGLIALLMGESVRGEDVRHSFQVVPDPKGKDEPGWADFFAFRPLQVWRLYSVKLYRMNDADENILTPI